MIEITRETAVEVRHPADGVSAVPLFFDSPHSGCIYPDDFNSLLPLMRLRRAEDAFVEDLFGDAPNLGSPLIDAKFPRSYLDPNRNEADFSPDDLADPWPGNLEPGKKAMNGTGLVWVRLHGLTEVYENKLTAAELKTRIDTCWRPYHQAIAQTFDRLYETFGCAYHLNCHSMRSTGNVKDPDGPVARPDFVLSDRDGTSCEPGFTGAAKSYLENQGYSVQVNFPMKGVELVKRYSNPAKKRHSMQIEINRRHYMDEEKIEKLPAYASFKDKITGLISELAAYATSRTR